MCCLQSIYIHRYVSLPLASVEYKLTKKIALQITLIYHISIFTPEMLSFASLVSDGQSKPGERLFKWFFGGDQIRIMFLRLGGGRVHYEGQRCVSQTPRTRISTVKQHGQTRQGEGKH